MGVEDKFNINLNQNLWGVGSGLRGAGHCRALVPAVAFQSVVRSRSHYDHFPSIHCDCLHMELLPGQIPEVAAQRAAHSLLHKPTSGSIVWVAGY